jgi:hypothetical protein
LDQVARTGREDGEEGKIKGERDLFAVTGFRDPLESVLTL